MMQKDLGTEDTDFEYFGIIFITSRLRKNLKGTVCHALSVDPAVTGVDFISVISLRFYDKEDIFFLGSSRENRSYCGWISYLDS